MSDGIDGSLRQLEEALEAARLWLVEARKAVERLREGVTPTTPDTGST